MRSSEAKLCNMSLKVVEHMGYHFQVLQNSAAVQGNTLVAVRARDFDSPVEPSSKKKKLA